MDNSTQTSLCKGLRAIGIPKKQTHEILNLIEKWIDSNGIDWTNSRIKDLRQWYETALSGKPVPPPWFKHGEDDMPLGIWSYVFNLPQPKALGVLSLNTCFYEKKLSDKQKEKFLHALEGNGTRQTERLRDLLSESGHVYSYRLGRDKSAFTREDLFSRLKVPTIFDMNGSIPVHDGRSTVRPESNIGSALKALELSWASVPQVTFDFLDRNDLLGYMPMDVLGNKYQLELDRKRSSIVGRVSILQQPQLKARVIGNPNRVTQTTLEPLKDLYMTFAKNLKTDVTFRQDEGVKWVQDQLSKGIELAGSDLTSASDLLSLELSLGLIHVTYPQISEAPGYKEFTSYFKQVSRSDWYCPALETNVSWKQGNVLGTGPSFGLLTLTNNAAALQALQLAKHHGKVPREAVPEDYFRVVGDDIIMRSEISHEYNLFIEALGGEINHSKTLVSDKVAEFAGRIIEPEACYLKVIKFCEPSDNSFMSYMQGLGDQAKFFLRKKQRRVYEELRYIPGIVVDGPWMKDSYGFSLQDRYQWYLEKVQPLLSREEPDRTLEEYALTLEKAWCKLREQGEQSIGEYATPYFEEDYQPSLVQNTFKVGGDPRLINDKSLLDATSQLIGKDSFQSFVDWVEIEYGLTEELATATAANFCRSLAQSKSSREKDLQEDTRDYARLPLEERIASARKQYLAQKLGDENMAPTRTRCKYDEPER